MNIKIAGAIAALECTVAALGMVERRDVRLDALLLNQSGKVCGVTITGIGHEPLGPKVEAVVGALNYTDNAAM